MAQDIAEQILFDKYGKENVEILEGNMARTPDGIVTLIQKTNPRHEIAAELYAIGMRQNEIEQLLKRDKSNGNSGYYSRILKHPMVVARKEEYAKELADKAKERLMGVVVKAADNIAAAVEGGHLPSSIQVLKSADVINPVQKTQKEVKVSFGAWLSAGQAKVIPVDPVQAGMQEMAEEAQLADSPSCVKDEQPIVTDVNEMSGNEEGERLNCELFDGDNNG